MHMRSDGASRFASPDGVAAAARVPRRDEAADARALGALRTSRQQTKCPA
jgi:hypothetical protein